MSRGTSHVGAEKQRLRRVGEGVSAYLQRSEQVFLETGGHLKEISGRAGRLVAASASVSAAGAAGAEPVGRLEVDLRAVSAGLSECRATLGGCSESLGQVIAGIDALDEFREEFHRVAVMLWTLAVSTRIENARGEGDRSGFEAVADDVRRLAGLIMPRFEAVLARAAVLRSTAEGADARARAFLERDAAGVEAELEATASRLASLRAMQGSAEALGEHATRGSQRIAGQVGDILVALQAHDSARQVLEHVRDALLAAAPDPETELADVAAVSRLQGAQLALGRELMAGALAELAAQLARVAGEASGLGREMTDLADLRGGTSMIEDIARGLRKASAAIVEQGARERETASVIGQVGEAMSELTAHAAAIRRIGAEVKIIALNAQVQAENAGKGGEALAVLAGAVRALSAEIDEQITRVCRIMTGVTDATARLDGGRAPGGAAAVELAVASMAALLERLCAQHGALHGGLEVIGSDGAALRREVERLSDKLAADGEVVRALGGLGAELEGIDAAASAEVSPSAAEAARARAAVFADRYTMDGERDVHRAVMGLVTSGAPAGCEEGPGAAIELF